MISRSSSTAGERLRRAKSTSSTHTSSSGHQRHRTSIDPFESRQHATAAAAEAYERARQYDVPTPRPVPPKLQRRRSQAAGKSEGSHFEDARRKSIAREGDAPRVRTQTSHYSSSSRARDTGSDEERVITRRRSVIPPSSEARQSQLHPSSSSQPNTGRHIRRRQSEYTDGSPMPRYSQTIPEHASILQAPSQPPDYTDGYGGNLDHLSDYGGPQMTAYSPTARSSMLPPQQLNMQDLNMARDQCLQDFQTKRVRQRKSFIFRPFEKRRATTYAASNFDSSLPPFNYADADGGAPIPTNPMPAYEIVRAEQKPRVLSGSLAGRLKKVFRKTSKAPAQVPVQHVQANEFHFTVRDTDVSEIDETCVDFGDPFMTVAAEEPKLVAYSGGAPAKTVASTGRESDGKSRVTSWANSTVAGMSSIRTNDGPFSTGLKRVDSKHSLRKASSFFGRPVLNKLRRTSKQELRGSEESQGLYSALQRRLRTTSSIEPVRDASVSASKETLQACDESALATLPSQMQHSLGTTSNRTCSTIRAITPVGMTAQNINICSPVEEVLSPEADFGDETVIHIETESPMSTPSSDLKRRPAVRAPRPSQEQLTRRAELSKNRWRAPLDELSPSIPHSSHFSMMAENPYELRTTSRTNRQSTPANDLPMHTRVIEDPANALSPSVYSRATDGASPRPLSPEDVGMTRITITGREVRTYDISPPKASRRDHGSQEWRKWLSAEINNWDPDQIDHRMPPHPSSAEADSSNGPRKVSERRDSALGNVGSNQGAVSAFSTIKQVPKELEPGRDRTGSAASTLSYMNERYPVIQSSRPSSRQSAATSHRVSSSNEPHHHRRSVVSSRKPSTESFRMTRPRPVSVAQSTTQKETAEQDEETPTTEQTEPTTTKRFSAPFTSTSTRPLKSSLRPKSAYELRASYKKNSSDQSRPLEVRRKAIEGSILEDSTVINITAGPYASQRQASTAGLENTPPLESSLPAMSSSEWLAPKRKGKEVRKASSMNPVSGSGSPGQNMVTSWLDGKRERERSGRGAFV